jgi:cytochrome c oxidase subunit 2
MTRKVGLAACLIVAMSLAAGAPAYAELPHDWGLWTLAPASPIMEELVKLHNALEIVAGVIVLVVFVLLGYVMVRFRASRNPTPSTVTHNTLLEVVWTAIPVVILVAIAFPSFRLLYAMDKVQNADLTIKVTGHQWYWSYAYPDYKIGFDSNVVQDADLKPGQPRLLTVDNPVVLPVGEVIRVQITADDVIHSWSVPEFGIKNDAVPGRLNESWVKIEAPGTYYGQCSQLCGINHGFMPIEVIALPKDQFEAWLDQHKPKAKSAAAMPAPGPVSGPVVAENVVRQ